MEPVPTVQAYAQGGERIVVLVNLVGRGIPVGTSARLYFLYAVGDWMQRSAAEQALSAMFREIEHAPSRAKPTRVDLGCVEADCSVVLAARCGRVRMVSVRVAFDSAVQEESSASLRRLYESVWWAQLGLSMHWHRCWMCLQC